jgi:hypothetical protein
MPTAITCPHCAATLRAPANIADGTAVTCLKCKARFVVRDARYEVLPDDGAPAGDRAVRVRRDVAPMPPRTTVVVPPGGAVREAPREYADCPFCGEEILAHARKCRFCKETLDVALRAAEEAGREARRDRDRRDRSVSQRTTVVIEGDNDEYVEFDHTIHLVLDLFSCGLWVPIHLLCYLLH